MCFRLTVVAIYSYLADALAPVLFNRKVVNNGRESRFDEIEIKEWRTSGGEGDKNEPWLKLLALNYDDFFALHLPSFFAVCVCVSLLICVW